MNKEELAKLISESNSILTHIKEFGENSQYVQNDAQRFHNGLFPLIKEFNDGGAKLLDDSNTLQIGVVGQVKAGKSSFLNSLFFEGESVLPKASTPMTAGLTVLEYADKNTFEVEYFTQEDWNVFVEQDKMYRQCEEEVRSNPELQGAPESRIRSEINKRTSEEDRSAHEMVTSCSSTAKGKIGAAVDIKPFSNTNDLQNVLEKFVGANGEYTSVVKSLYIKLNDERLKGYRIVDTPGVNDPVVSREERTKTFLRSCHCVMLLSSASDFLGSGDVQFLNSRVVNQGIKCVLLLASKFDSVLQDRGAEFLMKGQGQEDLVDAQEDQIKKFKRRLAQIKENIKGNVDIKIDFTAGIGYSLAHKPMEQWDAVEKNVAAQMKRFYPDYFSTDEDLKESFDSLSNVTDIKEKYLQKWFLENKNSIIQEKIDKYFENNITSLKEKVAKEVSELVKQNEVLQKTSSEEVKKQLENQKIIFKKLEGTLKDYLYVAKQNFQNVSKSIQNGVSIDFPYTPDTIGTSRSISYKGMLWGHNSDRFYYDQINTDKLHSDLDYAIESYTDEVNGKWKNNFKEIKTDLYTKLCDAIIDAAKEIQSEAFDDDYFRRIIDKVLAKLGAYEELDVKAIRRSLAPKITSLCKKQFVPASQYEVKKEYVSDELSDGLSLIIEEVKNGISALEDVTEYEVKRALDESMRAAINESSQLENDFVPQLNKVCENYMASLAEKLKEKEKSTNEMNALLEEALKLDALLKKMK